MKELFQGKFLITFCIFIATFMISVEVTIVTTAMPAIVSTLHGLELQNWVFATYLLASAISTPIYGKLSDVIGRKTIFLIGLALFTIGSALCGFAPTMLILIFARIIQGLGAGAILPITFTLIADNFPFKKRAKVIALNSTAWGISGLVGPLLGGFLVTTLSWHWIFLINVPLGSLIFALIYFKYHDAFTHKPLANLDYQGSGWFFVCLTSFLIGLQLLSEPTLSFLKIIICFLISLGAGTLFIRAEKHAVDPLIPLQLFKNRTFTLQILNALVLSGIIMGFQIYFPMWLQAIYKVNALTAGLVISPGPVGWVTTSFFVGTLMKKVAPKLLVFIVVTVQIAFYSVLIFSNTSLPIFWFYVIAGVTGSGLGIIINMNALLVQALVPKKNIGLATSLFTLGRTLGQTIMVGIFGLVFNISVNSGLARHPNVNLDILNDAVATTNNSTTHYSQAITHSINDVLMAAFHHIFLIVILLFILVFLINLTDPQRKPFKG